MIWYATFLLRIKGSFINAIVPLVVSTVMFGSIFAVFHIVDYVPTARAFFLIRHHCSKKVPVETEIFISLIP